MRGAGLGKGKETESATGQKDGLQACGAAGLKSTGTPQHFGGLPPGVQGFGKKKKSPYAFI